MLRADSHCDTITEIENQHMDIWENSLHLDIKRLERLAPFLQVMAVFINKKKAKLDEYLHFLKRISEINAQLANGVELVAAIEGLYLEKPCYRDVERLYENGVRMMSLTWNHSNALATGVSDATDFGLTKLGEEVVRACDELGIIVDVSHASEKTFYDIVKVSTKPIVASHSNAKALCNHKRNLTDEQIMIIKEKNGYIGVNFYPPFLRDTGEASISDIVKHFTYIADLVGEDKLGFGCDFDGIESCPREIRDVLDRVKVEEKLRQLGMSEKIFGENLKVLLKTK